ncbi:MAG: hypothetical protein DRI99_05545 [Candidatus Aminicenantes bacterium]|nr:MAG: hypothetical protein DRI99_05545 [Candidatus Aminicenantes bacterium]
MGYGEPGSNNPLPVLTNNGFTSPDLSQPVTNPITFTWKEEPEADFRLVKEKKSLMIFQLQQRLLGRMFINQGSGALNWLLA